MKNRSELFSHFRAFCAEIRTQFHVYVQNLRSDNTKEYLFEQFESLMLQNDILHQTYCVDTPSQNGVVERKNRHLLETAQALLFQMHMPKHFWADAVSTTCFLINRMPSLVLKWATPFQTLFSHKSLFPIEPRVFECTCFVWDVRPHVSKLDPKSLKGKGVIVLVFAGTWFLLMSHFLRMLLFLKIRSILVGGGGGGGGGMMICLILLPC